MNKTIDLKGLTVDEVNAIIFALGKKPYEQVFELIDKIQNQAREQLNKEEKESDTE